MRAAQPTLISPLAIRLFADSMESPARYARTKTSEGSIARGKGQVGVLNATGAVDAVAPGSGLPHIAQDITSLAVVDRDCCDLI